VSVYCTLHLYMQYAYLFCICVCFYLIIMIRRHEFSFLLTFHQFGALLILGSLLKLNVVHQFASET